jgi:uncharacterized protein (TIGR02145 family)|tara:strand:+ start:26 stop:673 length:648 start_codon:yes stop_codon:yes gene_type:complete
MENVKDIDGNSYKTVKIGDQIWMSENLKVTRYSNGDKIPTIHTDNEWKNLTTGSYTVHDYLSVYPALYGNLYNWYAVDDSRGFCPEGWHVPSDDEIKELEMYLGMSQKEADDTISYRGTNEGSKLAGMADLWNDSDLVNNSEFGTSGFNAVPGGYRDGWYGYYKVLAKNPANFFWSSTEDSKQYAWYREINGNSSKVNRWCYGKNYGFPVRCVKD